ncbi:hypothetical protein [Streptomyces hirsutus]|uniref:hypothetical protein n=1 Tax=Streptomyces hirsutus TaxID=35620 RepID=UPI00200EDC74|nr:hypothetical protein [Streptomyces hirsutus]
MAERVRVRETTDDEGRWLLRIIRSSSGSAVVRRRSRTVPLSVLGARNKQGVALSTDPRAIAESLGTITPRREGDAWRKVTTVDIPEVGTAARTYGIEDVPVAQGASRILRMVLTQTYIPVPGTADQVVLVSGASPVLDLAEAFHDIFDAVTSTFRFV